MQIVSPQSNTNGKIKGENCNECAIEEIKMSPL